MTELLSNGNILKILRKKLFFQIFEPNPNPNTLFRSGVEIESSEIIHWCVGVSEVLKTRQFEHRTQKQFKQEVILDSRIRVDNIFFATNSETDKKIM